ncbi:MAG: DUF4397 domain-containing protein [Acidimicrobiales bacterium]
MKKLWFGALMALLSLALLAAPSAAQDDGARIHLIHGIPGVDVDVEIAGEVAIGGFSFKDTQDLSDFAGQTLGDVKVKVAGTDDVAIDVGDLALPATGNVTAIAHLDAEGTPTVSVFNNDVSQIDAGEGRLTIRHAAAAPAVDVLAGDEVAFANISNGSEAGADLPTGTVSASVVPTGATEPVVIGPADLPVAEGTSLIVYAVGSLEGETIDVITETIDGLHGTPSVVNTGNSLVESPSSSAPLFAVAAASLLLMGVVAGSFFNGRRSAAMVNPSDEQR